MNKDKIISLSDREKARKKLPVFYGSFSIEATLHALRETLNNAVDEITNNFDSGSVIVAVSKDGRTITVQDTGRGIPIDGETDGVKNSELLLQRLFAGTNYENADNGKITSGQNGVGLAVLSHISKMFAVTSVKDGKAVTFSHTGDSEHLSRKEERVSRDSHGTKVVWQLDPEVLDDVEYPMGIVEEIVRNIACTSNNITFKLNDIDIAYDSLEAFYGEFAEQSVSKKISAVSPEIQVVMSTTINGEGRSYLNRNWLRDGGKINEGVVNGVKLWFNKYLRDNEKKPVQFTNADVETVLSFACHILTTSASYSGQTKLSTAATEYKTQAENFVRQCLDVELVKDKQNILKMLESLLEAQKLNGKAAAGRKKLTQALTSKIDSVSNKVDGLVDCRNHGLDSELFIAEGLSALSTVISARNPLNQAGFPIRGKIVNTTRITVDKALQNQEVFNIMKALGCGIESKHKEFGEFDPSKLRYGKIVLSADADPDGQQIVSLLLAMLYKLIPSVVKEGRVYVALPPLFEIKLKDDTVIYCSNDKQKDEAVAEHGKNIASIGRMKGLGETDASVMHETTLNPETRRILQVKVSSARELESIINKWLGADVSLRKETIYNNFKTNDEETI